MSGDKIKHQITQLPHNGQTRLRPSSQHLYHHQFASRSSENAFELDQQDVFKHDMRLLTAVQGDLLGPFGVMDFYEGPLQGCNFIYVFVSDL